MKLVDDPVAGEMPDKGGGGREDEQRRVAARKKRGTHVVILARILLAVLVETVRIENSVQLATVFGNGYADCKEWGRQLSN